MTAVEDPDELLTNGSVVVSAREVLPDEAWNRLVGGAESETTARRNRLALDCIGLRPRVLIGVGEIDPSTTLLGLPLRMPVLLAAIGDPRDIALHGPSATTAAAWSFGTIPFISGAHAGAPRSLDGPAVIEVCAHDSDDVIDEQIDIAGRDGWAAVSINLLPYGLGRREREPTSIRQEPPRTRDVWQIASRVAERTHLPVIAKGVTNGEDAIQAIDRGCRVIYVSNLGGRGIDHGRATVDVLSDVVRAVDGRAASIVDGGFARATDVVKALALGADAVAIGRLQGFGLAAGGESGLLRVLRNLEDEVRVTMSLLGVTDIGGITRDHVIENVHPVQLPHETSAFFRGPTVRRSFHEDE